MTQERRRNGKTLPERDGRSGPGWLAALAALVGWAMLVRLTEPGRPGLAAHPEAPDLGGTKADVGQAREPHRGRESAEPKDIPRPGWRDILIRTKNQIDEDSVDLVAAGVAFYGLLAIFPALAALISLYGLVFDPRQVQEQIAAVAGIIPEGARAILDEQLTRLASQRSDSLSIGAIVGTLLALWSAGKGTKAFITAMNIAYDEPERRGFFKLNLIALAFTLFVLVLAILAVATIVVLPAIMDSLGLGDDAKTLLSVIRWPVLAAVFALALALLYRFGPSRRPAQWKWVTWGSIAATILWLAGSALFSLYVSNFEDYNKTYGSIGAAVGMMMWFWLSAYIIILGAELNSEMERQTRVDTTTGRPKPLGQRGAVAADTVGEVP
jgi:membrane protein